MRIDSATIEAVIGCLRTSAAIMRLDAEKHRINGEPKKAEPNEGQADLNWLWASRLADALKKREETINVERADVDREIERLTGLLQRIRRR